MPLVEAEVCLYGVAFVYVVVGVAVVVVKSYFYTLFSAKK